jgi:hypothetical protein
MDCCLVYGAIAVALANVCFASISYGLLMMYQELMPLYVPAVVITLLFNSIYAACLIYSDSGKQFWLKWAGIIIGLCSLTVLVIYITHLMYGSQNEAEGSLEQISHWASRIAGLVPLLFILNFRNELKRTENNKYITKADQFSEIWLGLAGIAFLMLALTSVLSTLWQPVLSYLSIHL